jgi:hypothetical protein
MFQWPDCKPLSKLPVHRCQRCAGPADQGRRSKRPNGAYPDFPTIASNIDHLIYSDSNKRLSLAHAAEAAKWTRERQRRLQRYHGRCTYVSSECICYPGDNDVVDMRVLEGVRAAVVLEGGDDPTLRFDRGERRDSRVLQQLERRIVRRLGP